MVILVVKASAEVLGVARGHIVQSGCLLGLVI